MRLTIDLPSDLLRKAQSAVAAAGLTLEQYVISVLATTAKSRREPPSIDGPADLHLLTRSQLDEAMFGPTTAPTA